VQFPPGQHGVLYFDPPWYFENYSPAGEEKNPVAHYGCMTMADLKAMRDQVVFATAPNAVCVMWATFPMLPEAIDLMNCWGFDFCTGGAWNKLSNSGGQAFGTGYVLRSAAELFLIGSHGQPKIKNHSTRNSLFTGAIPTDLRDLGVCLSTLRREHSRKPDEMYPLIEALFEGPYLEVFARNQRPGWTSLGNEVEKFPEVAA
jgi:N6-adenosine-specific RNA methylase IME4